MTDTQEEAILVNVEGLMIITLNRPEAMNAINGALAHGILNAVPRLGRFRCIRKH